MSVSFPVEMTGLDLLVTGICFSLVYREAQLCAVFISSYSIHNTQESLKCVYESVEIFQVHKITGRSIAD